MPVSPRRSFAESAGLEESFVMTDHHIAAVDLGATSGRVMRAVVGPDRLEITEVARFANGPVRRQGSLHWDIEALREHVLSGLLAAFAEDPAITSVGIDSWAVDYALLSGDTMLGTPFHYRDDRTARGVAAVHAIVPPHELYDASGLQHLPFNTVFQLASEGSALNGADRFLLIPDLVAYWLTGRSVAESTNASTTALLHPRTRQWNDALISRLGLSRGMFAELVHPGDDLGGLTPAIAAELAAPAGVRVTAVGSHDTASAVVAVPMTRPDAAYISCGTWGLVGLELEHPVITDTSREANFTNEGGVDGRVRFLHNVMGLWLLSETIRSWEAATGPVDLTALLADAAAINESMPTFDVNDESFMPPGDMPGRITLALTTQGDPVPATRAAMARCILESLAEAFAAAVATAGLLTDREVGVIHIVGGGARNGLLCQLTADRSGVPVLAGPVEATALGNVLVQARALGLSGSLEDLRALVAEVYPPQRFEPRR
jgi:rhamnulokinase